MINFHHPTTLAAARAHVTSLYWRVGVGAVFAVGASLVLESVGAGFGWFLAVVLSTGFDAMLGHSYLSVRSKREQRTSGVMFVWGCAFSVLVFSAMTLFLASQAGGPGRVLAVLMAASVLVGGMLFLFQAKRFMLITAAPAAGCLLAMPFLPLGDNPSSIFMGELGAACGVVGFLAYVVRAAAHNASMMSGLRIATRQAKEGQLEAEAKRAEAEEANRAKSEFLAMMTHELRTPLNAVINYAEIIDEDLRADGRSELAADAARITHSANHLLGLIDQILHMTDASVAQENVSVRDVNTRQVLEECVSRVEDGARAAGNRISIRIAGDAEFARTDPAKLAIALGALLANAVKFTADGLIAVSAECDTSLGEEWLCIAVSDTGCGIAEERLADIFTPFSQADGTLSRAKGGIGLGLAIARRMARSLGGDISVTSTSGSGSTFTLRTPLRVHSGAGVRTVAAA